MTQNEESAEPQKKTAGERKVADMRKQLSDNIEAVTVKRTYTYNGRFAPLGHAWYLVQQIIKRGAKRLPVYFYFNHFLNSLLIVSAINM